VITGYDTRAALAYLLDGDRLAVLPSLVENSPLSILELIGASVPFLASTAGGIPESIHQADQVCRPRGAAPCSCGVCARRSTTYRSLIVRLLTVCGLVQADVLFPPELHSLAAKLQEALKHGVLLARPSVSVEDNERHWIQWHEVGPPLAVPPLLWHRHLCCSPSCASSVSTE